MTVKANQLSSNLSKFQLSVKLSVTVYASSDQVVAS
jgi:hypothetical protein